MAKVKDLSSYSNECLLEELARRLSDPQEKYIVKVGVKYFAWSTMERNGVPLKGKQAALVSSRRGAFQFKSKDAAVAATREYPIADYTKAHEVTVRRFKP